MHPVAQLIHARLRGEKDNFKLAVVAEDSGMKWVVLAGMGSRLEAHGLNVEICGGASGGGGIMLYFAHQHLVEGALILSHLTPAGFSPRKRKKFINIWRFFAGGLVQDMDSLIDYVMTDLIPAKWHAFQNLSRTFFVTATYKNGTEIVHYMNGTDAEMAKRFAKNTMRIPGFSGHISAHEYWDGGFSNGLPIGPALASGATHVLALRCCEGRQHWADRWLLTPYIRLRLPKIGQLMRRRGQQKLAILKTYEQDPRVQILTPHGHDVHSVTSNEKELFLGLLHGWNYLGRALQLPPLPYPALWQPTMVRLGLAEGAEFA